MKQYEEKIIKGEKLYDLYSSFLFLEGQRGLMDDVNDLFKMVNRNYVENWVIEDLFNHPERIKAVPYLNPDVIVFKTTMQSADKISYMIEHLQSVNWRPKEIWQQIYQNVPIVNTNEYNVFDFNILSDDEILIMKL